MFNLKYYTIYMENVKFQRKVRNEFNETDRLLHEIIGMVN